MIKRKEHKIDPEDIEISNFEFRLIMGDSWKHLNIFTESIFCTCSSPEKKLVDYKVYLTKLNDIVLQGKCSGCMTIAARYIETGENEANFEVAERIRELKKNNS